MKAVSNVYRANSTWRESFGMSVTYRLKETPKESTLSQDILYDAISRYGSSEVFLISLNGDKNKQFSPGE
jgi:hypothetical protein